ncbi:glycosyltransferase [Clostridium sp. HBUAS56017]|uniref:glycosyltransferase n=1 Tax=Clostridium sp. HBUAS56017 TaxID=2571128 RepID=UPI001178A089|nr:glycosyltransferase [Clostridium sp. HBUAS56017]
MKLSIAMIVKNEEKNLSKTLDALKALDGKIDYEIVIVDTGSEDSTIDIASKYTERVYEHPWSGNFAEMRNISLKYCEGEWILVLDADEVLETPEELISFFMDGRSEFFNSATVNIKNIISVKDKNYVMGSLFRLFKNISSFKFNGRIHEQPILTEPLGNTKISFLHNGYSRADYELVRYKNERNKKLLLEDLSKAKGNDKIYVLFQLAQTYAMANDDANTMSSIREAYRMTTQRRDGKINLYVLHFYAKELFTKQIYGKAIKIAEEAIQNKTTNLDFYYILALSYSNLKNYDKAQIYFDRYFEIREKRKDGIIEDITMIESAFDRKDEVLKERTICYYNSNEYKKVIETFDLIKDDKMKEVLKEIYIFSSLSVGDLNKFYNFYKSVKIEDRDIGNIISVIRRLDMEDTNNFSKGIKEKLIDFDDRLKVYINSIYFNKDEDILQNYNLIDFSSFYTWKSDLLIKLISKDKTKIELIGRLSKETAEAYVNAIIRDYDCLKILYEFSVDNFLAIDIKKLNFVTIVEKTLILSKSIEDDRYKSLLERTRINKLNLLRKIYNKEILSSDAIHSILNKYDIFWIENESLIKSASKNKLAYIKGLRELLKEFPEYGNVFGKYQEELKLNTITKEMELEKEKLFDIVEEYVNSNRTEEALEILASLDDLFMYDGKICNYKGVVEYLLGENEKAILNLAIAYELLEDKFDSAYNIACVLESMKRIDEAKAYYDLAYEHCKDNNMKAEILNIIQNL